MILTENIFFIGALYGLLAVCFGAFGSHALKKKLTPEQLQSFETGVKYQMYHALVLLILGWAVSFQKTSDTLMAWCFVLGVFLFSFSIYGLVLSASAGKKMRWLGPVTPLGGLLLVLGWGLLAYHLLVS
ncbi:MAG: DUF423 domain-containing protein [Bacteroidota bacterium]